MKCVQPMSILLSRSSAVLLVCLCSFSSLHAALFEDDEARRAILDLRQRVELMRSDADQARQASTQELTSMGRSLLDLQRQIELLKMEVATLRGNNEQLMRELSEVQRQQKDQALTVKERLSKLEPARVELDGVEFLADPAEKQEYEAALAVFRQGDYVKAEGLFSGFVARRPSSGYVVPALFWLGNAQYALRNYKEAMANFRTLITKDPEHVRAPEAVLSIANCQLELKDSKGARKTLSDLVKAYPKSEAAVAAKERLATLK